MRNRFKGLDLIDRVPDELWTEVCDIVEETGIKTIPMEKMQKSKGLSEEALQIAVKRREVKRLVEIRREKEGTGKIIHEVKIKVKTLKKEQTE